MEHDTDLELYLNIDFCMNFICSTTSCHLLKRVLNVGLQA